MVSCAGPTCFFKGDSTTTDNIIFRLHYKATVVLLLSFSIYVACKQYIGDPIDCISKDDIPSSLLDTFCWIHTTFSVSESWEKKIGEEVPYPGIDYHRPGAKIVFHGYYQWVSIVLFIQAILFYTPRYFWNSIERGRIKNLTSGLKLPLLSRETKEVNRKLLVDYMVSNMHSYNFYFMCYAIAEVMNFVNVVGQIFLTDAFLGGEFLNYGINVVQFTEWNWSLQVNPMIRVFPRLTKCTFHRYGRSGDVMRHDAMCVLPINIINEKIYLFLWFWFVILSVLSGVVLIYHALIWLVPKFRLQITSWRASFADRRDINIIIQKCSIGDWFVLDLLSKNLDPINLRDVINDFAGKIDR